MESQQWKMHFCTVEKKDPVEKKRSKFCSPLRPHSWSNLTSKIWNYSFFLQIFAWLFLGQIWISKKSDLASQWDMLRFLDQMPPKGWTEPFTESHTKVQLDTFHALVMSCICSFRPLKFYLEYLDADRADVFIWIIWARIKWEAKLTTPNRTALMALNLRIWSTKKTIANT